LSQEKQQQLILVALLTVMAIVGLYMGVIRAQKTKVADKKKMAADQADKNDKARRVMKFASQIDTDLTEVSNKLAVIEGGMASGDLYRWSVSLLSSIQARHPLVEIPGKERPTTNRVSMLVDFPYTATTFMVRGNANYHEFGKFLADFENSYPYFHVEKVRINPATTVSEADPEKLAFEMEVVALTRPGSGL
ncbi:MAG TPA: hypothetical protein VHH73_01575, partial [Verrucomicrobiae bacterium]|nr:hypothetical protein [Verrucomicrobiae bacterium]